MTARIYPVKDLVAAEGLHASSKGVRVEFSGRNRKVIDGPFAETKELIAGFWIWQVKSMEEAVDWVKRCPNPHNDDCHIEIRPIFELEDLGPAFDQRPTAANAVSDKRR